MMGICIGSESILWLIHTVHAPDGTGSDATSGVRRRLKHAASLEVATPLHLRESSASYVRPEPLWNLQVPDEILPAEVL